MLNSVSLGLYKQMQPNNNIRDTSSFNKKIWFKNCKSTSKTMFL